MRTRKRNLEPTKKLLLTMVLALPLNGCLTLAAGLSGCNVLAKSCEAPDPRWVGLAIPADRAMIAQAERASWAARPLDDLRLAGTITHAGTVLEDAKARLYSRDELWATGWTEADGTYEVSAFIEATKCYSNWALTLVFEHPDGRTSDPVAVDCGAQRVDFDF